MQHVLVLGATVLDFILLKYVFLKGIHWFKNLCGTEPIAWEGWFRAGCLQSDTQLQKTRDREV